MAKSYDEIIQSERNRIRGYDSKYNPDNNNKGRLNNIIGYGIVGLSIMAAAYMCSGKNTFDFSRNIDTCGDCKTEKSITNKPPKPDKPKKDTTKPPKKSGLENRLEDNTIINPKVDEPCYNIVRQMLTEPCFADPSVIYQENGVEYKYTGPGEDIEVPNRYNNKGQPRGKKTVHTHNFTSLDGTQEMPLREDHLNKIDKIYREKLVDCNEPITQIIEPVYEKKPLRNIINQIVRPRVIVPVNQGYNNTRIQIMAAGRNGAISFSSGNYGYGPNSWMGFGNWIPGFGMWSPGYQPTGYNVPQGWRNTRPEFNGNVLDEAGRPYRGSDQMIINSIKNTTKPTHWDRQNQNIYDYRPF